MQQAEVAAAITRLQAAGLAVCVQNLRRQIGRGSLRDIIKWRNAVLAQPGAVPLPDGVGHAPAGGPAVPGQSERPIALCYRCGRGVWHERVMGEWVCSTCGVVPPT